MSGILQERLKLSRDDKRALLSDLLRKKAFAKKVGLSFAQQRLWFMDQLEPGSSLYNISRAVRLKGQLSVEALQAALNEVVARHESLRTNFAMLDGQPLQVIAVPQEFKLQTTNLQELAPAEREQETRRLVRAESQRPFNLAQDQLLRASLFLLDREEYVLMLTIHHIVSDAWSMEVLFRELGTIYHAFGKDGHKMLPELPIQYSDFALWQRDWLQGEVLKEQLAYWKEQLAGATTLLGLPTDRPRPAIQTFNGADYERVLPQRLSESLKELSRAEGATLFMTLLAAFQTMLHRYTLQKDIVVGTPIANRTRQETEDLIGFFVNTLVMRADFSGDPTFKELLGRIRETALGAYAHQDLPFESLVEELQPARSLSHMPLFQVLFTLQSISKSHLELSELVLESYELEKRTAKFDLSLFASERPNDLALSFEYNTDLFDAATIERMAEHFETLLQGIVANPEQRASTLPLLTQAERRQLIVGWNQTDAANPHGNSLTEQFEDRVARSPEAIALEFEGEQLTYGELNRKANQLAHYLRGRGVGPDIPVGVFMERSVQMMIGLLGILKAGGAYVPLDPAYPSERLSFMLKDANVTVLLTQRALSERLAKHVTTVIELDGYWEVIAAESGENLKAEGSEENLAYVIYTSGSTGRPKGVAMPHRALINLLSWQLGDSGHFGPAKTLQFASLSFDVSFQEMFSTWLGGGTLLPVSEELRRDARALLRFLADNGIERLFCPFVFLQQLADVSKEEKWLPASLREIITAGEQLEITPQIAHFCKSLGCTLHNHYGPSESHVVTANTLSGPTEEWGTLPPIGRPIYNTQIYILDRQLEPVPIGVPGELFIAGANVARGYLNRPNLTAERFVPDPFSAEPGRRFYKTGDLARYLTNGNIEFLGRIDHQVKMRGFRVELGEIEAVLTRHPDVREAIVTAREDVPGHRQLVAYLVGQGTTGPGVAALRSFLSAKLPDYMVPATFVMLEELPLTPSGKVNRQALPAPDRTRFELDRQFVAPRTPSEEILAAIWGEVLRLDQVGIYNNFFELGGHSLLATQVISRIRHAFQLDLPLRTLFEAPTVAGLAERIDTLSRVESSEQVLRIVPVVRDGDLPLSFSQQRLWFLDLLEGESASYNVPWATRMKGELNVAALEKSLAALTQRHETLRTRFPLVGGGPVQLIEDGPCLGFSLTDVSDLPEQVRETEAKRLAHDSARRTFDLRKGQLLRAWLTRLGPADYVLLIVMHHIVSDGWSIGVFVRELTELYQSFSTGQPSSLPEMPIQYADYAVWQREWLKGEVLEKQLAYWRKQLSGAPAVLELPTDRPRPTIQTFCGEHKSVALSAGLGKALSELSRREGATLFMTLLSAFQILLYRYTHQPDLVVGTPIANRNRRETEDLIGFFVNTLVMRTDLSGDPSFRELLGRVRQVSLEAYAHQDLPFERLVEELQPERSLSFMPLFQVLFALQNAPRSGLKLPGLELEGFEFDRKTSKFDLSLYMSEGANRLTLSFEYNTDLFDAATIERMAGHFQTLLTAIVADPDQSIAELPLLTETERHRMLREWNDTALEYPPLCVYQLFEKQVERTPDAVALVFEDEEFTYSELNARANQLARYLQKLGVGPESLVGVFVDRSLEMLVALLGIVKAGGAYLPLDTKYPRERLSLMLNDAQVPVLLTQQRLLGELPDSGAKIIAVDRDWDLIAQESNENLPSLATTENLAYVIYTSGSTGKPKGVQITHRALANFLSSMRRQPGISPDDVMLSVTTLSFDIAGLELYLPLTVGARVVLVSREIASDGIRLAEKVKSSNATVMQATPATWRLLIEAGWQGNDQLKILCGGEALSREVADQLLKRAAAVWNLYGPTETTIWSTACRIEAKYKNIHIGRPIANTQTYVFDTNLQIVPIGVLGELYIGGDGLARGYLNRPELTAERFIPSPFGEQIGGRLYRTGDLARYLSDGNIEIIGRTDYQVKVRGFRIEPSEIEAALSSHPLVRQCVVTATETAPGDQRLVAYFVPDSEEKIREHEEREWQVEQVSQWQAVWDQTYTQNASLVDPKFNISGWNDSYTGLPIPADQMRDWVDNTVQRILSFKPSRVMEIGCGTGLLLFRIGPHCERYAGCDFSPAGLLQIEQELKRSQTMENVTLQQRVADDFDGVAPGSFDTVVLNSVVQYFPGAEYLLRVLESASEAVQSGGRIFVGDVRSLPLLETFHASVQLHHAPASLSREQLVQRWRRRLDQEQEMVVDPRFFAALKDHLPRIREVKILLKRGRHQNELTRFRYDVVLHVGDNVSCVTSPQSLDWQQQNLTLPTLEQLLSENNPETLLVTRVPNARLAQAAEASKLMANSDGPKTAGEIRSALQDVTLDGAADPEDVWQLSEQLSYSAEITWSVDPNCFDVMFRQRTGARAGSAEREVSCFPGQVAGQLPLSQYANNPLRAKLYNALVPDLRTHLRTQLPDFMVPQLFVMLENIPLTPNGKIDRRALPTPHAIPPRGKDSFAEPRSQYELTLQRIWEKLLNVQPIGVKDNFFDLGGHSLLAVRLMVEIEKAYGQRIPLVSLFQGATIEHLASILRHAVPSTSWPTSIEIQPGRGKQPLFCVSAPNVNALGYVFLARYLGDDQPVYGLQAQYPEDLEGEHSRFAVDEVATEYLEALRKLQPEGPYHFVGMCRGAHIAFEMAIRLRQDGEKVALLGILDTWVMENTYNWFLYVEYLARRLALLARKSPKEQLSFLSEKALNAVKKFTKGKPNGIEAEPQLNRRELLRKTYFPGPDFVPKVYNGRISVFRARRQPFNRIRDQELGWGKLAAGGVDLHFVSGSHGWSVLREPHVRVLAAELKKCLSETIIAPE